MCVMIYFEENSFIDLFLHKLTMTDRAVEGADANPLIHIVYGLHDITQGPD